MDKWIIPLLTAALFLAAISTLAAKPRFLSRLLGFMTIFSMVTGIVLYSLGYLYTIQGNTPLVIIRAVFSTMGMFLGKNDLSAISAAPFFGNIYILGLFWFIHFCAFYAFASAAIVTLGDSAIRQIRLALLRRGNLYLIYGANEDSISFGSALMKDSRDSVVFVDDLADPGSIQAIQAIGCLLLSSPGAVEPEGAFLKSIGAAPGRRRIELFALEKDFTSNIHYAGMFLAACEEAGIHAEQLSLTFLGYDEVIGAMFQAEEGRYGYQRVSVFSEQTLAARLLMRAYPPASALTFDAKARATEDFDALILGFGGFGQTLLKYLIQNGQFAGSAFHAAVFDPNYEMVSGSFMHECGPALRNLTGDVESHACDSRSAECYRYLTEHRKTLRYVAVCAGANGVNEELTASLQRFFFRNRISLPIFCLDHGGIRVLSENGRKVEHLKIFTPDILVSNALDSKAIALNHFYCSGNGKSAEENWKDCRYFDRMSSRASADFIDSLLIAAHTDREGVLSGNWHPDQESLENLGHTEHLRWCAFHYTMEYRPMSDTVFKARAEQYLKEKEAGIARPIRISKDTEHFRHAVLRSWEDLDALSAAESAITGEAVDYKKSTIHTIEQIPEIIRKEAVS